MGWMDDLSSWLKNSLKYSIEEGKSLGTLREAYQRLRRDPGNIDHAVRWQTALAPHLPLTPSGHGNSVMLDLNLLKVIRRRDKFYEDLLDLLAEQLKSDTTGILLEFAQDLRLTLDIVTGDQDCPSEVCQRAQVVRRLIKGRAEGLGGSPFLESQNSSLPTFPSFPGADERAPRHEVKQPLPPAPPPLPAHVPAPPPSARRSREQERVPPPAPPPLPFDEDMLRLNIALLRAQENGDLLGASQTLQTLTDEAIAGGPEAARKALHALRIPTRAFLRVPPGGMSGPGDGQALLHVLVRSQLTLIPHAGMETGLDETLPALEHDLVELLEIAMRAQAPAFRPAVSLAAAKIHPMRGLEKAQPYRQVLRMLPDLVPGGDPRSWRIPAEVARRQVEAEEDGKVLTVEELVRLVVRDSLKDGQLSAKENRFLKVLTKTLGLPPETVKEMVRIEARIVEEAGRDPGELDERNLFRRAVFVAAADGVFQDDERKLLVALANILRLPSAVAQEILNEGKQKLIEARQASASIPPPRLTPDLADAVGRLQVLGQLRRHLPQRLPRPQDHWKADPQVSAWESGPRNPFDLRLRVIAPTTANRPGPLICLDFKGSPSALHAWLAGDHLEIVVHREGGGPAALSLDNRSLDREILTTPLFSREVILALEAHMKESAGRLEVATIEWESGAPHRAWTVSGGLDFSGHLGRALAHLRGGERDAAREALEKANAASPTVPGILWRMGALLQLSGRSTEAEACLVREIELGHPAPEAGVHLARLCWRTGRRQEAMRRLGTVLATCPDHVAAWITRLEMWLQDPADPADPRGILELLALAKYRAPEEPELAGIVEGVSTRLGRPVEDELWLHLGNREPAPFVIPAGK